jgi:hypothetical protein
MPSSSLKNETNLAEIQALGERLIIYFVQFLLDFKLHTAKETEKHDIFCDFMVVSRKPVGD